MSIKIMSAIFETEFRDLPLGEDERMAKASSLKIVMLAIADHANDEGEAYPGFNRLILKTSLSRQGLTDVLKALRHNGVVSVSDEKSKLGSNLYQIELDCFPKIADKTDKRLVVKWLDQSSGFTDGSQVALQEVVKPLDHNHQLTTIKPSLALQPNTFKPQGIEQKIFAGLPVEESDLDTFTPKVKDAANLLDMACHGGGVLAEAFMIARLLIIPESKIKGNRKAAREMLDMGVKPEHVTQAVKDLTSKGMTVTDLFSVTKTSIDLANKAASAPKDRSFAL